MASVNISEREFNLVAEAAERLLDEGRRDDAYVLDDLARKMNSALSRGALPAAVRAYADPERREPLEVESPLESRGLREKAAPKKKRKSKRILGQGSPELNKALTTLLQMDEQTEGWIRVIKGQGMDDDSCCANEKRTIDGGCVSCGDPCF